MIGKLTVILLFSFIQLSHPGFSFIKSALQEKSTEYLKKGKAKSNKNKPKITEDSKKCKPPKENLIVVNFSGAKLTLYVNGKKAGTVKPMDQFSFKYILPVGEAEVKLTQGQTPVHEEVFDIVSNGKQTCNTSKSIIVR